MKQTLLQRLNETYLSLHIPKEEAFWSEKMGLKSAVPGAFVTAEVLLQNFISDSSWISEIEKALSNDPLTPTERVGLNGWKRLFSLNAIESEEARQLKSEILQIESEIQSKVQKNAWGYVDQKTKVQIPTSLNRLGLMIGTAPEETDRKAALEALRSMERFVLDNGFLDLVKMRNRLARTMGFEDFYAYRVQLNEGFSVDELFKILDLFESQSRKTCQASIDKVIASHGKSALEPWNFRYFVSGDLEKQLDPYFDFEASVERWARSFARLGVDFRKAKLTVDLVNRSGKYHNGFMHAPFPSFVDENGFRSARINFTANAVPGQIGSGKRALETLFHEGGHAAHFSNVEMPAVAFSQEYSPTSMAFAETQSMFMDHLVSDPQWLGRYARTKEGSVIPADLIETVVRKDRAYAAWNVRSLMVVPYGERAIYAIPDDQRTVDRVIQVVRSAEDRLAMTHGHSRPILSVPHLLSGESSATYHGYVLALFAVEQTRQHFMRRDGFIADNPKVGPELATRYWKPGNSKTLFEFVRGLTGEDFSAKAMLTHVNMPSDQMRAQVERVCDRIKSVPVDTSPIRLNAEIRFVHGDDTIAAYQPNQDFADCAAQFAGWLSSQQSGA